MVGSRWIPTRPIKIRPVTIGGTHHYWVCHCHVRQPLDKIRADVTDAIEATRGNRAVGGPHTSPYE